MVSPGGSVSSIAASERSGSNCLSLRDRRTDDPGPALNACSWTRRKKGYSSAVMGRIGYVSAMMVFISRAARWMRMIFDGNIFARLGKLPGKMERGPRATNTICG
jgi:hypothetical protein